MEFLSSAKSELIRSNVDHKHPFRLFTLATQSAYPELRTVVKRTIKDNLSIVFFTDSRSPKVEHIKQNKYVSALFYHPKKKLQVRIRGAAELLDSSHQDFPAYLNQVKQSRSIQDYTTTLPPGTYLREFAAISHVEEIHFLPILIHPKEVDVLQLSREGHQRALYTFKNGDWTEQLLVP